MILFVNACVRAESRTRKLAEKVMKDLEGDRKELKVYEVKFPDTTEDFLKWRDECIEKGDFTDSYFDLAKQFAAADTIVMAAPYWDLSFPATIKQYIEHINVVGLTFKYSPEGIPQSLCKAKKLYYVMTAGGNFVPEEYGFGYIKTMAESFYGIKDVELVKEVGLDIV